MTDQTAMTPDLDTDDVYDLFQSLRPRHIKSIRTPTAGAFVIEFEGKNPAQEHPRPTDMDWRFEVALRSGNMWLHARLDGDTEEVWSETRRR